MFFLLENNLLGKTLGWFSLIFLGHGLREATTCIIRVINSAASSSTNVKDFELLMSTLLMMDRHFHVLLKSAFFIQPSILTWVRVKTQSFCSI
jgi:hypothetical protein